MTTATEQLTTYYVSVRVPHYYFMAIERPIGMTDQEIKESITQQDLVEADRDEIEVRDFFNDDDWYLTSCEYDE